MPSPTPVLNSGAPWRALLAASGLALGAPLFGQLAISANDSHLTQVNGTNLTTPQAGPDSLTLIDLGVFPPKVVGAISDVPNSVIGPPFSVALTPDERLALVVSSMKVDPGDATKQTEDNRVTVVDLKARKVVATVTAGVAPAAVAISRAGDRALVANRGDGSVSLFKIDGFTITPLATLSVGNAASALGGIAFTADGKAGLVSRDGDSLITVFKIEGDQLSLAGRDLRAGFRPYGLDVAKDGTFAVVGNVGFGTGDADTISVIDLTRDPFRVVQTMSIGTTPEGVKLSPDGRYVAVIEHDGSTKPKGSPFRTDHGHVVILRIEQMKLTRVCDARIGHWSQGAAFSADGKTILVGNMVEKTVQVFTFDGKSLKESAPAIPVPGGSATLSTARR